MLDDAESCKNKMQAASALIAGLGGEKIRWTQQSKEFQDQIGRYERLFIWLVGKCAYIWRMLIEIDVICSLTKHLGALRTRLTRVRSFQIELEFRVLVYLLSSEQLKERSTPANVKNRDAQDVSSRVAIFTRARLLLALLSLRKMMDFSKSTGVLVLREEWKPEYLKEQSHRAREETLLTYNVRQGYEPHCW